MLQEGDDNYSQISSDENNFLRDDELPSNMVLLLLALFIALFCLMRSHEV
jgi:hypothetical protein